MPLNCGNLHIRTQATDPTLSPNTITQLIVSTGLQIGIIPESTVSGLSPYTITIKNESNEILYESPSPQAQSGVGSYIYAIIPFASIPNIGDNISIKIYSNGTTCEFTTTYTVLDYSTPTTTTSTTSTTSSTTINTSGIIEKYIHIQPTSNAGGYSVGNTYYFKCSSNNVTDDVCLLEFQNNLDPSKILNSLPSGTSIAVCPPSLDWIMLDVLCIAYPTTTMGSTSTTTTQPSDITIVEPNKPQYYYSNNQSASYYNNTSNLPIMFFNESTYNPNDLVWMYNDNIKVGINLKRGGQIAYISKSGSNTNLINNKYDGGRQIQPDIYQVPSGYTQGGQSTTNAGFDVPDAYNVTQGGDRTNKAVSLIDYRKIGTGSYYIKLRPNIFPLSGQLSETYIESTYTLIENSLKIEYTYKSFRTDGQYTNLAGTVYDAGAFPACFIIPKYNKYKVYNGSNPWTNDSLSTGTIPNVSLGGTSLDVSSSEKWLMVYSDDNLESGIGLYNPSTKGSILKQVDVYEGDDLGEYGNGFTYMHVGLDLIPYNDPYIGIPDRSNFTFTTTSYLAIGTSDEIRSRFYQIHNE